MMMRKKRILIVPLAMMLILPSFLADASQKSVSTEEKVNEQTDGKISSKDEVVYATLQANGQLNEIYVVNTLDVTQAGTIIDYGSYNSLKNLTDLSDLTQTDDKVYIEASKGKFYYQGNTNELELPWDLEIVYFLDGKEMNPAENVGENGHLEITINTSRNEQGETIFFDNYLLQISLTLDSEFYQNIEASDGVIANAGTDKQITFTVLPEQEGNFAVTADVRDFEFEGIEIAALPSSMSIDAPDAEKMTEDMKSLTDAIKEINDGVADLKSGVSELNDGVISLRNGSEQYKNGMSEMTGASSELIKASSSINDALSTITKNISKNDNELDLSELSELPKGLSQIADGLTETANGLSLLQENYSIVLTTLDEAMRNIPEYNVSENEINDLYSSGADPAVLDQLVETYSAARVAKGTYSAVKEGLQVVDTTLGEVSGASMEMATTLTSIAQGLSSSLEGMDGLDGLTQLQEGLAALAANYEQFHGGLIKYTNGVDTLSSSYHELHSGIVQLNGGTTELEDGVGQLLDGTGELYKSTNDLPEQIQEEIDKMISEYDKSDFEAISFVSGENEKVNSVQFVIKTESVKKEEQETMEEVIEEEKGFWGRLKDLFS
ncbi:YhgE/Pip domain-containing protein [Halalkalibacter krulwichiae]|nr:YhgE/Pip domain-containing protein [Halalkalibacter krulwichiae]